MADFDNLFRQHREWRRFLQGLTPPLSSSYTEIQRILKEREEQNRALGRLIDDNLKPLQQFRTDALATSTGFTSLADARSLRTVWADALAQQAQAFSPLSSALATTANSLASSLANYTSIASELNRPAWMDVVKAFERVREAGIEELRRTVPDELVVEEMEGTFPSAPAQPTLEAARDFMRSVRDWLDLLSGYAKPSSRTIALVSSLLKLMIAFVVGVAGSDVATHLHERHSQSSDGPSTELERSLKGELDDLQKQILKKFDAFAAREQFVARVKKRAPVMDVANSGGRRLARLDAGTKVRVLQRSGRWYQVEYGMGDVGWVFEANLERVDGSAARLYRPRACNRSRNPLTVITGIPAKRADRELVLVARDDILRTSHYGALQNRVVGLVARRGIEPLHQ
jgi:hypothetical protein